MALQCVSAVIFYDVLFQIQKQHLKLLVMSFPRGLLSLLRGTGGFWIKMVFTVVIA